MSEQEITQEEQQDENAFAAGFSNVRGDEPPTPEEPATPEASEPEPEGEPEPQEEEEAPIFDGLTPSQLKAKLGEIDQLKQQMQGDTRRAFGKVGELNSRIQQLQERIETFQKQPDVTPAKLERLAEEYPDLAELLNEDMGALLANRGPDVDKLVSDRMDAALKDVNGKFERKLVAVIHPDWQDIKESEEFGAYLGTLSQDDVKSLLESEDGIEVANGLTKFKTWREEARKQQTEEEVAQRQKQDRQRRLEAAAQPAGLAPAGQVVSEDDAFASGFKRVRGVKL